MAQWRGQLFPGASQGISVPEIRVHDVKVDCFQNLWFGDLKSLLYKYLYKVTINLLLFFSYCSTKIKFVVKKYYNCGHVITCFINSVKGFFSLSLSLSIFFCFNIIISLFLNFINVM